ncbi:hypothetical protein, partial [Streptococcus pneumoniae]|uniref:hypothetical protein n=1 Tax=Streptococcus pneumoniae TaxID=1313 RepID=UPI001256B79A
MEEMILSKAYVQERDRYDGPDIHPVWLAKARRQDLLIDVLFNSGNGLHPVHQGWFQRAPSVRVFGSLVRLVPVEEMILSKAYVQERDRYDGPDIH